MYTVSLAVQITLFLYYYTLLNWGEGVGQYNCRTTWSCIIRPYYQAAGRTQYKKILDRPVGSIVAASGKQGCTL